MATKDKKKTGKWDLSDVKGVEFVTPRAKGVWLDLFKPRKYKEDSVEKYSATLLFQKKQDLKAMRSKIKEAASEVFGKDESKWPKANPNTGKGGLSLPWRDGDEKEDVEWYHGHHYVTTSTQSKPLVVDRNKEKIEIESEIYPGIECHARIRAKVTESGGNYFVTLYLQGFMKWDDGEQLGGGQGNAEEMFGELDGDDASSSNDDDSSDSDSDDDSDDNFLR